MRQSLSSLALDPMIDSSVNNTSLFYADELNQDFLDLARDFFDYDDEDGEKMVV